MQDTGKFRKNTKDQFYTKDSVARACIQTLLATCPTSQYTWVDPSAGNGAFLRNFPHTNSVGMDIDPQGNGILHQDYLTWTPPAGDFLVIGNPPFGRQSTLAKSFIRKSCEFATMVAFILPRSFTKPSMFHVFPPQFHLLSSTEIEFNSFLLNGEPYDVPCVFQIWQKQTMNRLPSEKVEPHGFVYVRDTSYHFACRRVGVFAGKCYLNYGTVYSPQSHYFIRLNDATNLLAILDYMNQHEFPSNTVGPRSLSQTEINVVLNDLLKM